MKKVCLIFLVLAVAGSALAVDRNWTNGNGNRLWTTAANWSGSVVPTSADKAAIRNSAISGPIINTGMAAVANQIVVGDWSSTSDSITITGGTLTTSGTSCWFTLGYSAGNSGTLNVSGGTITAGSTLYIGRLGTGIVNMTGGTINVATTLAIPQQATGVGNVHLDGGTISCATLTMISGGLVDITAGTLIVNGDVTSTINTYKTNGWITAYGGSGTLNVSYNTPNAGKTTVTATPATTGVDRNWTNGNGNRLWGTAANWSGGVVPTSADKAAVRNTAVLGPIIGSGTNAVANQVVVGDWSSTNDTLDMTGGTLTTNSWVIFGYSATNHGTFNISAGTVDVGGDLFAGNSGIGTINMTGGSVTVSGTLGIAQLTGSTGDLFLDGGTISCGSLNMTSGGGIDITAGTLIVNGDVTTLVNTYKTNGWIIGYGGSGTVNVSYNTPNAGMTTVTATQSSNPPAKATSPIPANGATGINTGADIIWTPGAGATSHDVYFGTTSPGTFRVNQTGNGYDPGTLANSTTYYWRINEKNAYGTTTGDVWSFTTAAAVQANRRKGPYLIYPGVNTQMTVLWQIDVTTGCNIAWGTSTSYSSGSANTTEYGTDHQHKYNITGLTPGTRYYYRVTIGSNNYTGSFNAAPASNATAVKFFMYGDTRSNGGSHNTVAGQVVSAYNADAAYRSLVLHAADWVSADSESAYTGEWYNYSWTNIVNATSNVAYMGAIGNHEGGASIWKKYHPFPFVAARYFSFDYGPVHVAVVDQYTSYTSGSAQYNWLSADLTNSTKLFKIIVLHQPGWSCNGGHSNDGTVQSTIQPLAVSKGVSIVLGGHNHYYSRAVVSGVHHITHGGGGAPLYTPASGQPNIVTYTKSLAVSKVVVSGNTLTCTTVNGSGSVIDTFTITK